MIAIRKTHTETKDFKYWQYTDIETIAAKIYWN